ncbi:LysM peptidoglycan-binding domain-containing protein [Georgenia halophila]|uniref:LysM peptidoglycan-binding domain-containing protein n=1 Tax=Georgenia halophila TaxID=620889 RepID=A0ABP8L0K9_9MICO
MRSDHPHPVRAAPLLLLVSAVPGVWLGRSALRLTASLTAPSGVHDLADAVSALCLWGGCLVAAWYALTCACSLVVQSARATGRRTLTLERTVRRWGFPVLRRALLTTAAAGTGATIALSSATATQEPADPALPFDLGWSAHTAQPAERGTHPEPTHPGGREPVRADDPERDQPDQTSPQTSAPAGRADQQPGSPDADVTPVADGADADVDTYLVRAGDTLWSIAAAHLGPGASDSDVAAAWPAWYEANSSRVGADPDLIHPDLLLRVPTEEP